MMRRTLALVSLAALIAAPGIVAAQSAPSPPVPTQSGSASPSAQPTANDVPLPESAGPGGAPDPYLWLEDVHGERAMTWVRAENAKTTAVLEKDPRYAALYAHALAIAQAKDRLPLPDQVGGRLYNFWQDAGHVRGILRVTTNADYAAAFPRWKTVLDLDALSKSENANWFYHGMDCHEPREDRCIVRLSDGGEDATTEREFDLRSHRFVDGGFRLPHGKQNVAWERDDTLLVSREWKPGDLTASGYPYIVKRLVRGRALDDATEIFRGKPSDVSVQPETFHDGAGQQCTVIDRGLTFFESEYYLVTSAGPKRLEMPHKVGPAALVAGRLVLKLDESWSVDGLELPAGSVAWVNLAAATADPAHLHPRLLYAPGPRESIDSVSATKSHVLLVTYQNVRGRAFSFAPNAVGWAKTRIVFPDNSTIDVADTTRFSDQAYLSVTNFLTPTTLWQVDAASGVRTLAKRSPSRFDASRDTVDQFEAKSSDGTRIPYFVVHPKRFTLDGSHPTILTAYGGFQISETPYYSGTTGKLWLEHGGVYVLANIRGGGEFGPAWHEAGLKTHRQRIYDDFAAVAEDLIARKITTPRRLGIQGGSNGGLLMGVEMTQHPGLFRAVDIAVPLLDMLRYEQIAAGASWVAEYGSVSNPVERAFLASISPYNNLKPGVPYPTPLIWTTTKDDRVGPQHARKFAAKMAELGDPYYFYEVIEGGHASGANFKERARTNALEYTYFYERLVD